MNGDRDMKAKIVSIVLLLLLILSSYTFATIPHGEKQYILVSQNFSPPSLTSNEDSINIHVQGVEQTLFLPNEPVVPVHVEVLTFPLGTKITGIRGLPHKIHTLPLTKELQTAPLR